MAGSAGFGLISEAVTPGFDFADMEMGNRQKLSEQFCRLPTKKTIHKPLIERQIPCDLSSQIENFKEFSSFVHICGICLFWW
jgi:hypothetical protein